ncbi:multidrug resistance-associated protein 5 [Elysia marginata]|uniref:Multidrug resistance-associated protein 5 n=1 Tax=Elysia marginata TaxID=1093978 RepID=A0AAV4GKN3_9GAST|nr:multidrug resistance-associated protein 5 [Elysia marginata]
MKSNGEVVSFSKSLKSADVRSGRRTGIGKYGDGLKKALPVRVGKRPKDQIPLETNGLINYSTFGWLTPILWGVFKRGVDHVKGLQITKKESAEVNAERMGRYWQAERAAKGDEAASFGKAIFRSFKTRLIIGVFASLLQAFLSLAIPIIVIQYFLKYLASEQEEVTLKGGILYVVLLGLVIVSRGVAGSFSWMLNFEAASRIKYGCLALLYQKVLRVKSLQGKTEGDMANFISNDGQRIWDGIIMGPFILGGPMILVISSVYCVVYLGPWALVSVGIVIGFFPFMVTFAKMSEKFKDTSIKLTDKRVALVTQLLSSIKLIKMCVWEKAFTGTVAQLREAEAAVLSKSVFVTSLNMGVAMLVPVLAACVCFVAYVANGNNLSPTQAFTFVALLNTMQSGMMTIPFALKSLAEMAVTTRRIQEILLLDELESYPALEDGSADVVRLTNASFSWGKLASKQEEADEELKKSSKGGKKKKPASSEEQERLNETEQEATRVTAPVLHDITVSLKQGTLIGVCGSVGSGKTSLIKAILGRMELVSGEVALTSGQVAFTPQQAWVINDTLRDNITFGKSFEPDRYKAVVEACALAQDFKTFPAGDITEVGERGANLSGGQRQRLCLARATYSEAGVVLLDDPLSAVDSHVASHIFQQCIVGQLKASGRTVVLVSHQLKFLKECDEIIVMKNGAIAEQGSHDQLLTNGKEYANLITLFTEKKDSSSVDPRAVDYPPNTPDVIAEHSGPVTDNGKTYQGTQKPEKLIQEEQMGGAALDLGVVGQYVDHMGGWCVGTILLASFCLPVAGATLASWFLSFWLEQGGGTALMVVSNKTANWTVPSMRVVDNPDRCYYLLIYLLIVLGTVVLTLFKSLAVTKWTLTASTSIHRKGIQQIVSSPMAFFDATPIGRMVNRFSADLDEIDSRLPMNLDVFLTNVLQIVGAVVIISYVSPWFLLAVVPLGAVFMFVWTVFHRSIRQLKMLDNVTRSPVIGHLTTSIQGLASISAFQRAPDFQQQHCQLLDSNSVAVLLFYSANRWLALRLDMVSAGIAVVTGFLVLVTYGHLNPALAGLALSYCVQMSGLFQFTTRLAVETEARLTSAQRILEYCNLREVEGNGNTQKPGDKWPFRGEVVFNNVKLRYREAAPLALDDINVEIHPGENIGIVGRTGAGKSSLAVALFRLVELESGNIVIDGLDTSDLDLECLRRSLSIIPQDPVLFTASVRYNLDPFQEFSDSDLWQALEKCHIKALVEDLDGQLDFIVTEAGANFSVGQKQLFCMARTLLRDSKVVVLDEATAAIDLETDRLMQDTLRDAFEGCTLLVIAHRLTSVVSCDRVIVMENGKVSEYDTPENLMGRPDSVFKSMLDAAS